MNSTLLHCLFEFRNAYDGDVENLDATIDFTIDLLKRFASCQYHEVLKY